MRHGFIVDDQGEVWPDDSSELARRLDLPCFGNGLATKAVDEHGFVHLRRRDDSVHVALPVGRFTLACFAGTMQMLGDLQPVRIVACLGSDRGGKKYEIFASIFDFAERVEPLEKGGGVRIKPFSRIAIPRSLRNLNLPLFAAARPIYRIWKDTRGRLTPEVKQAFITGELLRRVVLLHKMSRSSRLVVEHFSSAITIMRPCDALLLVGREMGSMYDQEYGRWAQPAYGEVLSSNEPRLEAIIADIRTQDTVIRARYDRLILPWHSGRHDKFALGVSLLRNRVVL